MSGGVDSSTAAYLLLTQGYEVIGVSLDLFDFSKVVEHRAGTCCSLDDLYDARAVAHELGIPHYVFNFREIFEKEVISNFVDEYISGRTPNPCIICNDVMKFRILLKRAKAIGTDFVATGHYARIKENKNGTRSLLKGIDNNKDQSYFLYRLTQENLPHILFPCGGYRKKEIREIAGKAGLPVKDKDESQEICFVTEKSYREFLSSRGVEEREGEIVTISGKVLGTHKGIHHYTVGQRRGLGISGDDPLFIIQIDGDRNRIVVGPEEYLYARGAVVENATLVEESGTLDEGEVKVRYRSESVPSKFTIEGGKIIVNFDKNIKSVTPGQALVIYRGERVLGGGVISERIGITQ